MALPLNIRNPSDLTSTYAQIEISRATSEGGSYSVVTTKDIDTTTASDLSTGYTSYTDGSGDTTKWYKFRYKTSGGSYSSYSDEFQGGTTTVDSRFRRYMRDTNSNNYFFTNDDIAGLRRDAIYSLYPATWFESIDETLSTDGTTEKFSFPSGVTRVNDIEFLNSDGSAVSRPSGWKPRGNQIIFSYAPTNGYTIRLYVDKMFRSLAEVPEIFDEYILKKMMLDAYYIMEADRSKYYKYNSVTKSEGGNLASLRLTIQNLERTVEKRLNDLRRVRKPAMINMA